ncbi:hypothetical protein EIP86_007095 [Pleurotus ostreatoroseus]|nr:hypothetical protein EIP86_007095 [Pleurotus ostreatoroseus]
MSTSTRRKAPPVFCLTPPPEGPCTCSDRCPVHDVSVLDVEDRYSVVDSPPPSLLEVPETDSEDESDKENTPPRPSASVPPSTPLMPINETTLRRQMASLNLVGAFDQLCRFSRSNHDDEHNYSDDACPPTPMRLSGVVGPDERTWDQPPPAPIQRAYIVSNGMDVERGRRAVCGVFDDEELALMLTSSAPGQIYHTHANFSSAWNAWMDGWDRGTLIGEVHPQSIWRRVVPVEEYEQRVRDRVPSQSIAAPPPSQIVASPIPSVAAVPHFMRDQFVMPAAPIAPASPGTFDLPAALVAPSPTAALAAPIAPAAPAAPAASAAPAAPDLMDNL